MLVAEKASKITEQQQYAGTTVARYKHTRDLDSLTLGILRRMCRRGDNTVIGEAARRH